MKNPWLRLLLLGSIFFVGSALPAFAVKDFSVKNDTQSYLFVSGTNGNMGVGTTAPAAKLHIGSTPPSGSANLSSESVLIKGNLEVDGKLYGDGSMLTGVSGISGLTTYAVPRAASATSIVDSGIYLDANGNVGIGSVSPGQLVDIKGGNLNLVTGNVRVGNGGTVLASGQLYAAGFTLWATSTNLNLYSGNAGYGVVMPSRAATQIPVKVTGFAAQTGDLTQWLDSNNYFLTSVNAQGNIGIGTSAQRARLEIAGSGSTTGTAFQIDDSLYNPKVTVLDNGNVGIGSVNPSEKLIVVSGANKVELATLSNGQYSIRGTNAAKFSDYYFYNSSGGNIYNYNGISLMNVNSSNNINFLSGKIFINSTTGNMGVGTTAPMAKFELVASGSTSGTAFQIDDNAYNPKVTVLDNGYVGVGTITPVASLHVGVGTPNAFDASKTTNAYIAGDLEVDGKLYGDGSGLTGINGISGLTGSAGDGYLPRASGSTSLVDSNIYQDATGHIGIGTTDNQSELNIGSSTEPLRIRRTTTSTTGAIGVLRLRLLSSNTVANGFANAIVFNMQDAAGAEVSSVASFSSVWDDATTQKAGLRFGVKPASAGGGERMRLNGDGNLGIGSSAPMAKLDVVASGSASGQVMVIRDSALVSKVTVLDNGNVGIGTTAPVASIHVGAGTPNAFDTTKTANAYIVGDLEVDGKLYGDGSGLTGVGGISGLTTYGVPKASSSTMIIDSGIYVDANGNVGIGTTVPFGALSLSATPSVWSAPPLVNLSNTALSSGAIGGTYLGLNAPNGSTADLIHFQVNNATRFKVDTFGHVYAGRLIINDDPDSEIISGLWGINLNGNATHPVQVTTALLVGYAGGGSSYTSGSLLVSSNVGVGSTAPRAKLEIVASGSTTGTAFQIDDNAYNPKVTVLDNGNVGIGSTLPGQQLDVMDQTTGVSIYGNQSFGAGFVMGHQDFILGTNATNYLVMYGSGGVNLGTGSRIYLNGNVGMGTSVPLALLQVGNNPTIASGSTPAAAIKGNLVVDGYLYGNGSNLTGLSGGISGLTTYAVPRASSSTTLIDSGIYLDANGNVGIGTMQPISSFDVESSSTTKNTIYAAAKGNASTISVYGQYMGNQNGIGVKGETDAAHASSVGVFAYSNGAGTALVAQSSQPGSTAALFSNSHGLNAAAVVTIEQGGVGPVLTAMGGNVGIGTTGPRAKLELVGAGSTTGTAFQIDDNLYNPKFTVLDNGYVGIQTSNPNAPLMVGGGADASGEGAQLFVSPASGDGIIGVRNAVSDIEGYFRTYPGSGTTYTSGVHYGSLTNHDVNFFSNDTGRMIITNLGNIGIGTIAPRGTLEVDGSLYIPNTFGNIGFGTTEAGTLLTVGPTPPTLIAGSSPVAALKGDLVVDGKLYGDGSGLTGISGSISGLSATRLPKASSGTTLADSVIYEVGGNIGIGTSNPVQFFNVSGGNILLTNTQALPNNLPDAAIANSAVFRYGTMSGGPILDLVRADGRTLRMVTASVLGSGDNFFQLIPAQGSSGAGAWGILESYGMGAGMAVGTGDTTPLTFYTNRLRQMTIASGGNVGIGTTVPGARVEIVGTGSTTGKLFQIDDSNYSPKVTVLDNGNVGIGSSRPQAVLAVASDSVSAGAIANFINRYSSSSAAGAGMIGYSDDGAALASGDRLGFFLLGGSVDASHTLVNAVGMMGYVSENWSSSNQGGELVFVTTPNGSTIASRAERLRISNTGFVGIGTSIPEALLHVGAGTPNAFDTTKTTNAYIAGDLEVDGKLYGDGSGLTGVGGISGLTAGYIAKASTATTIVDSGIYEKSGNIGIGTLSPDAVLTLDGGAFSASEKILQLRYSGGDKVTIRRNGSNHGVDMYLGTATGSSDSGGRLFVNTIAGKAYSNAPLSFDLQNSTAYFSFKDYAGVDKMRLDGNGNLGIGTYRPLSKLDIGVGSIPALMISSNNGNSTHGDYLIVTSTGNVGVGTTTPVASFHVGAGTPNAFDTSKTTNAYIAGDLEVDGKLYGDGSGLTGVGGITGLTTYAVPRASSSTTIVDSGIYLDANGNVGINSVSPNAKLNVVTTATTDPAIRTNAVIYGNIIGATSFVGIANGGVFQSNGGNALKLVDWSTANILQSLTVSNLYTSSNVGVGSTVPRARLEVVGSGSTTGTAFQIDDNAYNPKVTVLDNGNVGIGSTLPRSLLDITGSKALSYGITAGSGLLTVGTWGSAGSVFINTPSVNSAYPSGLGIDGTYSNPISTIKLIAGGAYFPGYASILTLSTTNGANIYERMRIDINGNVAVGTIVPLAKLEVVGSGTATGKAFQIDDGAYNPKVTVLDNGNVGIGTTIPVQSFEVKGGDVYVNHTSSKLIMKKPDGTCSACGPDNADVWVCSAVTCP